jgi:hypothetical protein
MYVCMYVCMNAGMNMCRGTATGEISAAAPGRRVKGRKNEYFK